MQGATVKVMVDGEGNYKKRERHEKICCGMVRVSLQRWSGGETTENAEDAERGENGGPIRTFVWRVPCRDQGFVYSVFLVVAFLSPVASRDIIMSSHLC